MLATFIPERACDRCDESWMHFISFVKVALETCTYTYQAHKHTDMIWCLLGHCLTTTQQTSLIAISSGNEESTATGLESSPFAEWFSGMNIDDQDNPSLDS